MLIYDFLKLYDTTTTSLDDMPSALREAAINSSNKYRVHPPICVSAGKNSTCEKEAFSHLIDAMLEDSETPTRYESFDEWCKVGAEILYRYM